MLSSFIKDKVLTRQQFVNEVTYIHEAINTYV
jgi:hypothetical protein